MQEEINNNKKKTCLTGEVFICTSVVHANIKHLMSAFFRDTDERKRDARLTLSSHNQTVIASPNSLQLSSAGTRHSHYNKHSLLMLRSHRTALTQTQRTRIWRKEKNLCLIGQLENESQNKSQKNNMGRHVKISWRHSRHQYFGFWRAWTL